MTELKAIVDYGIITVLVFMSVAAVAVAIERFKYYSKVKTEEFESLELYEIALTKRLYIIATVGSNAPYVGLLGTVLGIMQTFYALGADGGVNVSAIMTGLALALKATAAGLVTAIPAIVLYNILLRRANEMILAKSASK